MGLGQAPGRATRAHFPATRMAAFHMVVRLLGPPDDRGALGHNRAQAVAPAPVRDRRASLWEAAAAPAPEPARLGPRRSRQSPPSLRTSARRVLAEAAHTGSGPARSRALDRRPAGSRRKLGRDPATDGLLDDRARAAGLPARPPRPRRRDRGPGCLRSRGRPRAAGSRRASLQSGTPLWRLSHWPMRVRRPTTRR